MKQLALCFALAAIACTDLTDGQDSEDLVSGEAVSTAQQEVSGSYQTAYSNYPFPGGTFYNKDVDITVEIDPGAAGARYFAHQFSFQNTVGYLGLQTDGNGKRINFAIWNAVGATPAAGATCAPFSNEGSGRYCRIPYDWKQDRTYRLRIWAWSPTSWGAWVLDRATGSETYVGSIQTRSGDGYLTGASDTWTEYYGGDFASCSALRLSRVRWGYPTANNGSVGSWGPSGSTGPGECGHLRSSIDGIQSVGERQRSCGSMAPGNRLSRGEILPSCDGRFRLTMQHDGNLVLYQHGTALWSSGTPGTAGLETVVQGDGNVVLYPSRGGALWHTHTYNHPGAWLAVQTDGNMVVYSSSSQALWASNTCCR